MRSPASKQARRQAQHLDRRYETLRNAARFSRGDKEVVRAFVLFARAVLPPDSAKRLDRVDGFCNALDSSVPLSKIIKASKQAHRMTL